MAQPSPACVADSSIELHVGCAWRAAAAIRLRPDSNRRPANLDRHARKKRRSDQVRQPRSCNATPPSRRDRCRFGDFGSGYLEGHASVTVGTAEWIAGLLSGTAPAMPLDAATGPGEVMPPSWLYPKLAEVELAAGGFMSLYNGSPCATGFVTDAALTSARRLRLTERVFALAVEAGAAPLDAYDAALQDITADPDHRDILRRLNELLDGVPKSGRLPHQAPVSWRIVPTALATVARTGRSAEETAEQSLRSIAHNPVYLPPAHFCTELLPMAGKTLSPRAEMVNWRPV